MTPAEFLPWDRPPTDSELRAECLERLEQFQREDGFDISQAIAAVHIQTGDVLFRVAQELRKRVPGATAGALGRALFEADEEVRAFVQSRVDLGDPALADATARRATAWAAAMQIAWSRDELGARRRYTNLARATMPGLERGLK